MQRFLNNKVFGILLLVISLVYIVSFYFRIPNFDEGIIAEWAFWISNKGYARSVLYSPIEGGLENIIYVYHKLIAWSAALLISVFGMEILPLRIFIFCFLLLTLFSFYKYGQLFYKGSDSKLFFFVASVIILFFTSEFKFSFTFRPEVMVAGFGVSGFLFIKKGVTQQNIWGVVLGAIFSGLAFLTHLNGIAFLIAGFVILLWAKNYRYFLIYCFVGGITALFFFANDLSIDAPMHFLNQLQQSPDIAKDHFKWWGPLKKVIDEHMRFFHSPVEISLSVLFLFTLIFSGKDFRTKHQFLLRYLLILVIAMGGLTHGKTSKYLLIYLPFMVMTIANFAVYYKEVKSRKTTAFLAIVFIYMGIQIAYIIPQFEPHHNVKKYSQVVFQHIPEGSTVFGNSNLVFDGVSRYEIYDKLTFEFRAEELGYNKNLEGYLEFANRFNSEYAILTKIYANEKYWDELHAFELSSGDFVYDHFKVSTVNPEFVILKRIE